MNNRSQLLNGVASIVRTGGQPPVPAVGSFETDDVALIEKCDRARRYRVSGAWMLLYGVKVRITAVERSLKTGKVRVRFVRIVSQ